MDTTGAVDLSLDATLLHGPKLLDDPTHQLLLNLGDMQRDIPSAVWLEEQLVRLALASVIEARLLHVRGQRLVSFDLPKDPSVVTLKQLAALWRSHRGAVGQAFELAVADAVGHAVPEVTEPLRRALALLGIHETGPLQMVLVGLEKVPANLRETAATSMLSVIPEGTLLRTGQPGRPMKPSTVAARLTQTTWAGMRGAADGAQSEGELAVRYDRERRQAVTDSRARISQLPRADALLVAGGAMVGVSMKVNLNGTLAEGARDGWRDVPLWITRTRRGARSTRVTARLDAKVTMVVVELADNRWTRCFETALRVLEEALNEIDLGRPRRPNSTTATCHAGEIAKLLVKRAHLPVKDVTAELRSVTHSVALAMDGKILAAPTHASLTTVDEPSLLRAWEAESSGGGLYAGQQHLFFGA